MVIRITTSPYFSPLSTNPLFGLGEIVSSKVNHSQKGNEICVVIGINYNDAHKCWMYHLKFLVDLSYWYQSEKYPIKPQAIVLMSEHQIYPLSLRQRAKFEQAYQNLQELIRYRNKYSLE